MFSFITYITLWLWLFCDLLHGGGANNLVMTGVIDGPLPNGLPKAIELYAVDDIADLSLYGFGSANNGGGSDGQEYTFPSDSLTSGDYIYISYESTQFNNFFGFSPDYTSGFANINGDDAIELYYNGVVTDTFGDPNIDGTGEPWAYEDGWAYREGDTGPDGTTFVLNNWYFSGINELDGETTNANAVNPFPIGTYDDIPLSESLIITGVIDGPLANGLPKAIEIYVRRDVNDLSLYGLGSANNGDGSDGEEYTFSGAATEGDFIYISYPTDTTGFVSYFGFNPTDTSIAALFDGDDAIELFYKGVVVDLFGNIDISGTGQSWEYLDGWAYRVGCTGPDDNSFDVSNWLFSGVDALDGSTTNENAITPFPYGTYSDIDIICTPPTTFDPTNQPTEQPTEVPTDKPTTEPSDKPTNSPTDRPSNSPTDPPTWVTPCVNSPCNCNVGTEGFEDPNCKICHSIGCSQCKGGYWKKNFNYPCVGCQEIFGNECMHCQDINGCSQCKQDYTRVRDEISQIWYCEASPCIDDNNNCQVCNNGMCSQCRNGYTLNADGKSCS